MRHFINFACCRRILFSLDGHGGGGLEWDGTDISLMSSCLLCTVIATVGIDLVKRAKLNFGWHAKWDL